MIRQGWTSPRLGLQRWLAGCLCSPLGSSENRWTTCLVEAPQYSLLPQRLSRPRREAQPTQQPGQGSADATFDASHPGVLKRHQVVEDEGFIYIVTDRHDKTLEGLFIEHRRRKSPVSVAVTLSIVRQVAAALAYLHGASGVDANGLVHRDLRPANVLVSADGEYFVIAGLGLCRDALWSESTFAGTAAYMAPEALLRSEASPASDMWGLGVIVYELATLRRPDFLGDREPREVFVDGWRPELSGVADDLIKGILERIFVLEPEKRLTARELHKMLTVPDIPVSELGAQYVKLKGECHSLETALNSANARIALLEDELRAKADRIIALRQTTREGQRQPMTSRQARQRRRPRTGAQSQARRIGALEDQAKGLESTLGQVGDGVSTAGPQQAPLAA